MGDAFAAELLGGRRQNVGDATDQSSAGVSPAALQASTSVITFEGDGTEEGQCMVCLENFHSGEELRILPCNHRFHKACIDPWLQVNNKCPACNHQMPL